MQVSRFVAATAAVLAIVGAGCSTPLSLRGARVLEPGEVEVIVSPQVQVPTIIGVAGGTTAASAVTRPYGWAEGSVRFGIADRVDLQLRLDPSIIPEISFGYQLIGDPTRNDDFALTLTAGIKPTFAIIGSLVSVPLQLLVDAPINDTVAVTGGVRLIPNVFSVFGVANVFSFAPGVVGGIRVKSGAFVFQPELGVSGNVPIGANVGSETVGFFGAGVGLGVFSVTLGLNIGGQFDLRPVTVAPAPVAPRAAPVVEPAPTPVEPAPTPMTAPPAPVEPAPIEGSPPPAPVAPN